MRYRFYAGSRRLLALLLAAVLTLAFSGCDKKSPLDESKSSSEEDVSSEPEAPSEYPVTVEGVTIKSRPTRIISLSPALTEKLFELELTENLVGISTNCDYPEKVSLLPDCGTAQIPDLEVIGNLKPHLVLAQVQLDEESLIALQQMDTDVVIIPMASTIDEWTSSYLSLCRLLEGEYSGGALGEAFIKNINDKLDYLNGYLNKYTEENGRKPALYLRLLDFNVATGDTLESKLLDVICLDNIALEYTDWVYPSDEANGNGRKAFESVKVIYMDEKFVNIKMLEQSAYYKGLQATLKDWYLYIDSLVFERQSLRMLAALEEMAKYAYPDAVPSAPFVSNADPSEIQWADDDTDEVLEEPAE